MQDVAQRVLRGLGLLFCVVALSGGAVALVALADPTVVQASDDGNPFGSAESLPLRLLRLAAFSALGLAGAAILRSQRPRA